MAFSYGKLPQSPQLPAAINVTDPLYTSIRKLKLLSGFFLIVFAAVPIIVVSMFFSGTTEMLTNHPSFTDGDTVSFLLWAAILIGSFIGLRYPTKWWKRIGGALFFSVIIFALFMALAVGTYDRFQEYRLFNKGRSTIDYEKFSVVDVNRSSKKRLSDGRPRHVYAVIESSKYRKQGQLSTNHQTYDFLLANRRELSTDDWRPRYDTGHCVKLRVEHNGTSARIRIYGEITMDQLVKCPLVPSQQSEAVTKGSW
jgi:hypothetical protein